MLPIRLTHVLNGRPVRIEVSAVGQSRWRAQIASAPGGITALMPFYGSTPAEAAEKLTSWLGRAGGAPNAATPPVGAQVRSR